MVPADGGVIAPNSSTRNDHSDENRRVSDKILAAFSHAYAVSEFDTATKLRNILVEHEAEYAAPGERRKRSDPVAQADLWVAFIEARNCYNSISEKKGVSQDRIETALTEMKNAYQIWSQY